MKTKKKSAVALVMLAILVTLLSCSSEKSRDSSSNTEGGAGVSLLPDSIDTILNEIESSGFSNDCVTYLQNLESTLAVIKSSQLIEKGPQLAKGFWKVQLSLHDALPGVSIDCVKEIRNTEKLLRAAQDYLVERESLPSDPTFPYQTFYRHGISNSFKFKDGDILVVRGNDFLSSLLSRVGDHTSQFSQMIFIHVDPSTQETKGISSYIGPGAKIFNIEKAITENGTDNVRVLILRGKDQDLASRAADFTFKRFSSQLADGKAVPFDYTMTTSDHSVFTSSKIVQYGYETISNGDFSLPQHPSHFSDETSLTKRLGFEPSNIFNPEDIEVDNRFDLIGEWRNPKLTESSRRKDVVMESVLDWIKKERYNLQNGARTSGATDEGAWPFFSKAPESHVLPKKIPHKILYTAAELSFVTDILFDELTRQDEAFQKSNSHPMSAGELRSALEKFKAHDLEFWKGKKTRFKSRFHQYFRP